MRTIILYLTCILSTASVFANDDARKVGSVIDNLHHMAATANFDGYFDLYSDNAVFIGTDASEVWSVDEFKAYAKPHFDKGTGWTYHPRNRHIYFSSDNNVAWFDELLDNESLGETRGTGVLIKVGDTWKISQYHLTIPVPNSIADDVADLIKQANK